MSIEVTVDRLFVYIKNKNRLSKKSIIKPKCLIEKLHSYNNKLGR